MVPSRKGLAGAVKTPTPSPTVAPLPQRAVEAGDPFLGDL